MQLGGSLIETRIIPLELVCMEVLPPPQPAARRTTVEAIEKAANAQSEFAKLG
jgi:hypothetical protein